MIWMIVMATDDDTAGHVEAGHSDCAARLDVPSA